MGHLVHIILMISHIMRPFIVSIRNLTDYYTGSLHYVVEMPMSDELLLINPMHRHPGEFGLARGQLIPATHDTAADASRYEHV